MPWKDRQHNLLWPKAPHERKMCLTRRYTSIFVHIGVDPAPHATLLHQRRTKERRA